MVPSPDPLHTSPRGTPAAYSLARDRYADWGVDTEEAIDRLGKTPISLHCWQGDDVAGFENPGAALGGGLAVTGNHPGRARNGDELRADLDAALSHIPCRHRINLHAMYAETAGRKVERTDFAPVHFQRWIDWACERKAGLDFNPTFFSHPLAADGFTLSHRDVSIRRYWIEHGIASRKIGAAMGAAAQSPCITNFWIPDGYKDTPADRWAPRQWLTESLDAIFREPIPEEMNLDAVESKLFGIGSESYVTGSHDFYLGYAITRRKLLCLDTGHFHPTESVADKISAILPYVPALLLHVSRGVRWDSDHVPAFSDDLQSLAREALRGAGRIHFGLDYFDASINRIAAWIMGARNLLKALLAALLEPAALLRQAELSGDYTKRFALREQQHTMPFGAVWEEHCERRGMDGQNLWLDEVLRREKEILAARG